MTYAEDDWALATGCVYGRTGDHVFFGEGARWHKKIYTTLIKWRPLHAGLACFPLPQKNRRQCVDESCWARLVPSVVGVAEF
jgi:hypothetical protein